MQKWSPPPKMVETQKILQICSNHQKVRKTILTKKLTPTPSHMQKLSPAKNSSFTTPKIPNIKRHSNYRKLHVLNYQQFLCQHSILFHNPSKIINHHSQPQRNSFIYCYQVVCIICVYCVYIIYNKCVYYVCL